jgi:voltage-dependent potassium channel beta subunit
MSQQSEQSAMRYRRVGASGLHVSVISLGGWLTFGGSIKDAQLSKEIIEAALHHGVNFFDQADVYAKGDSERAMGEVLKPHNRDRLVISSKVYWPMSDDVNDRGLSRKHIMQSIDASLRRLQTDYLDMYFCHRYDPNTPLEEVVTAMSDLVQQGKILYWGTSEWSGAQIAEAVTFAKAHGLRPPIVEQPQYSLVYRDRVEHDVLPAASRHGVGLVVWSPLGMGLLTGKYDHAQPEGARLSTENSLGSRYLAPANIEKVRQIKHIADELAVTRAQLALAWVLRQQQVSSAIVGATSVSQIEDNLKAASLVLSDNVVKQLDAIFSPHML